MSNAPRLMALVLVPLLLAPFGHAAKLGDAAAPLKVSKWVKGGPVTLEKGKNIYVVEFWATWCPPCRASIPHLTELQKKYKDKGVVFIGVSDEDVATVAPFVEKMGEKMDYAVAVDDNQQTSDAYMAAYGQEGIPTAFVVDKELRVAWVGHPMGGLEETVDQVLAGTYDIAAAQKRMELRPVIEKLVREFLTACRDGKAEKANAAAESLLKQFGDDADLMNQVAWTLLTFDNEAVRNPKLALKIAQAAMKASKGKDASVVDTYARALFMTGDVKGAIEQQKKAIELAPDEMKKDLQKVLDEYLAKPQSAPSATAR